MSEDPVQTNIGQGRRFLLAVIDGGGTVPPALGVAADLVRRGHQVRVLADPTIEVAALAAGCAFSPWQQAPHFNSRAEQTAMIAAVEGRNPYRLLKALRDFAGQGMTKRYAHDVITTAQAFPVDAVLAEGAVPGIVIGALGTGLPTAALMPNIYLRPTRRVPTYGNWLAAGTWRYGQGEGPAGAEGGAVAAREDPPSHERGADRLWAAPDPGVVRSAGQMQPGAGDDESIIRLRPSSDYRTMSATSVPNSTTRSGRPSRRGDGPVANRSSSWRQARSSNIKPACCSG